MWSYDVGNGLKEEEKQKYVNSWKSDKHNTHSARLLTCRRLDWRFFARYFVVFSFNVRGH
eukprot:m.260638 g.260638  ORF g.260638 m.260638 type:complete len:60 (-) comp19681_c0_seq21:2831-3010(-)